MLWALIERIFESLFVRIIGEEIKAWSPHQLEKLVRYHASKLPTEIEERWLEEWLAELDATPGTLKKIYFALCLFTAIPRMNWEHSLPNILFSSWTASTLRVLDILISGLTIMCATPLSLLIALIVKISGSGPILLRRQFIGRAGRKFDLLIFNVSDNIFINQFLNRTALNQLPVLVNVLKGDLSLVGPLPFRANSILDNRNIQIGAFRPGIAPYFKCLRSTEDFCTADSLIQRHLVSISEWARDYSIGAYFKSMALVVVYVLKRDFVALDNHRF